MKLSVLSYMAWGAGVTVMLAFAVILLSSVLGMGLALTRLYAWPPLRLLAAGYALVSRGIPLSSEIVDRLDSVDGGGGPIPDRISIDLALAPWSSSVDTT